MQNRLLHLPVLVIAGPVLASLLLAAAQPDSPADTTNPATLLADQQLPSAPPRTKEGKTDKPEVKLVDADGMEKLAQTAPLEFLEQSIRRYERDVTGFTARLAKQEFAGGKLHPPEVIDVWFKDKPHSARLQWVKGARLASRVLYVEGENKGKLLVKPAGLFALAGIVERDVDGDEARQSGRYPLNQFGIKKGTERTLATWKAADNRKALTVKYLGKRKVPELDDRECFVLHRPCDKPENDGILDTTFYFDCENFLQTGSVLRGEKGTLIGSYFFANLKLNPEFPADTFTRQGLNR
jgi:hypothetical protein